MLFKYERRTDRILVFSERMKPAAKEIAVEGRILRTTASKYNIDKIIVIIIHSPPKNMKKLEEKQILLPNKFLLIINNSC